MAISKTVIKLNHIEAVVKIVNDTAVDATIAIDLDVDLLKPNEVIEGTVKVAISQMEFSVAEAAFITITRNAVPVYVLSSTEAFDLSYGADHTEEQSDILVTMGKGTLLIRLLKADGFEPKFRPEQGVQLP